MAELAWLLLIPVSAFLVVGALIHLAHPARGRGGLKGGLAAGSVVFGLWAGVGFSVWLGGLAFVVGVLAGMAVPASLGYGHLLRRWRLFSSAQLSTAGGYRDGRLDLTLEVIPRRDLAPTQVVWQLNYFSQLEGEGEMVYFLPRTLRRGQTPVISRWPRSVSTMIGFELQVSAEDLLVQRAGDRLGVSATIHTKNGPAITVESDLEGALESPTGSVF